MIELIYEKSKKETIEEFATVGEAIDGIVRKYKVTSALFGNKRKDKVELRGMSEKAVADCANELWNEERKLNKDKEIKEKLSNDKIKEVTDKEWL